MDVRDWMPAGMTQQDRDSFVAEATDESGVDGHLAAALAWEHWAASGAGLPPEEGGGFSSVASVSTGSQSVTYSGPGGGTPVGEALARARWHRARSRVGSVRVGPEHETGEERGNWVPWVL